MGRSDPSPLLLVALLRLEAEGVLNERPPKSDIVQLSGEAVFEGPASEFRSLRVIVELGIRLLRVYGVG